ncbi:MAG: gamma-glutamylcyclotransferase [Cyanobacteriota bacterium]|jgi:gamma-glutamylcyclotransferase (GGCT)/AIG2-like uncharacterized protein YtfP
MLNAGRGRETPLFVYGTLKRGQANHAHLQGARHLGAASLEGASLHDLGPFPMAIAAEGRVVGELYAVDPAALPRLDAFEGCPRLYQRHWRTLADGRQAWVYLGQPRQVRHAPHLPDGEWPPAPRRSAAAAMVLALPLLTALGLGAARAGGFDTPGACQSWRGSHGLARLELSNAIGAANALTKRRAFAESTPEKPVMLYDPGDIARVCGRP